MKPNLQIAAILAAFLTFSASAQQTPPDRQKVSYAQGMHLGLELKPTGAELDADAIAQGIKDVLEGKPTRLKESEVATLLNQAQVNGFASQARKEKQNVSYAVGMHRGLQLRRVGAEVDTDEIAQGIKDVLDGKPTKIQESEIEPLFRQAQAWGIAQQSTKNKSAGETFLAKNGREPDITTLPDGLQYRVIQAGAGETPSTNDLIFIKYRGRFIDGHEFDHNDHFLTRSSGGIKGLQEALQRMKVGSKWQLFVPSDLAHGHDGEAVHRIGPDSTLIYDLELVSIAHPGDPGIGTGSVGHGLEGEISQSNPPK
jgi:FKBP-type peptidyl-prolyl cis-trans isomerase FklB